MGLSVRHQISIALIPIYSLFLLIGIFLAIRHGFGRNAGWLYLILLSLIRLIGASLDLATINDPTNIDLFIGGATLQSIGLSALILLLLGLVGRVLASAAQTRPQAASIITPRRLRLVQTIVIVGLALGIAAGVKAGTNVAQNGPGSFNSKTSLAKASVALMIVGFVAVVGVTALVAVYSRGGVIPAGDGRLLLAIALSLPFVLVRLVYSCVSTFGNDKRFGGLTGDVYVRLGMSIIMEIVVVLICEAAGLTLEKAPKHHDHGSAGAVARGKEAREDA